MFQFLVIVLVLLPLTASAANLTIRDALDRAKEHARSLKISTTYEREAAENVRLSRSTLFPRIDIQTGYTVQQAPQGISLPQGDFETQQANFGSFNLSLYQTIYDFGRTAARQERAEALHEAVAIDHQSKEQSLFLRTIIAYYRILQIEKLLQSADQETAQMDAHLKVAKNFHEQGVVTRNDLLQAEVRLAASRQRRLDTANRLENGWLVFNDIIGEAPGFRASLLEEKDAGEPKREVAAAEPASERSELRAQRKMLEAAKADVKEMKGNFYPELFARLGMDYVENSKVKEQAIYFAMLGLKVNVFGGYTDSARYGKALQAVARSNEELQQTISDLDLEYRIAFNDASVAKKRIAVTEASLRQGEENLRINRDRYGEQVGTATDVVDAQSLLSQMRAEYFQAVFDFEVALARVKRARGEL